MQITKQKLEKLYLENDNKEVCRILGITNPTLISYLKHYKIKLKGKGRRNHSTKIELS